MENVNLLLRSASVTGQTLFGVVHAYGTRALVNGRYEEFAPGAFDEVLRRADTDVVAFWNHDRNLLLGRQSSGTVRLSNEEGELRFEIDLPDTTYANDLKVLAERGDVGGTSFGFIPGRVERLHAADGRQVRRHISVRALVEISPVSLPAYTGTSVNLRGQDFEVESVGSQLVRAKARVRRGFAN